MRRWRGFCLRCARRWGSDEAVVMNVVEAMEMVGV